MSGYKLFVSHTCRVPEDEEEFPDAASRAKERRRREARLAALCGGLHAAGFRVLVDRGYEMAGGETFADHILAGDDWSLRLDEWLAECHAAVIVFNRAALEHSWWVSKEAAILSWRRALDPEFKLIPVLLDGVTADDLRTGLHGVLDIARNQCVSGADEPAAIVRAVTEGLGGPAAMPKDTPLGRLENVIQAVLADAGASVLETAWNRLGSPNKPPWRAQAGVTFAAALARAMIRAGPQALASFRRLLGELPRPPAEQADQVFECLSCLWVPSEAAGRVPVMGATGAAALNGAYVGEFTAERYVARAWLLDPRVRVVHAACGRWSAESIREQIRAPFARGALRSATPERLDRRINREDAPILVLLHDIQQPDRLPDAFILDEVRGSYGRVLFLLDTGPRLPDWVPEEWSLDPPVDLDEEEEALDQYDQTQDMLDRIYGRQARDG